MTSENTCPIWGTPAEIAKEDYEHVLHVNSARAGGRYTIFANLKADKLDPAVKVRLTTWIISQHRFGIESPKITREVIDEVKRLRPLSAHERADRLLSHIEKRMPAIGDTIKIPPSGQDDAMRAVLAWSESIKTSEVIYLLDYLETVRWIEQSPHKNLDGTREYGVSPSGYAHLAELETKSINSEQAFVAMWFDGSVNDAYEKGIEPAIRDAGYRPLRIDKKDHNNKIDDQIIAEIRRSRFVVADFTHGEAGMRGGVYYEAGFAHGLNIPVIFTCREDVISQIHFDTRQYNHIIWKPKKLGEFRKALSDRISATIGDGPLKKNS